jgi:hypothetical protein
MQKKVYCKVGKFSFKYLGVPLHYEKLRREDFQSIVDRINYTYISMAH